MATPAQVQANCRNAQKSSGPKSEEGKARSCRNHLSHGFTSSAVLIPGEDREEYKALLADLMDEHQPATPTEQIYVERMVQNQWHSLRAVRLQATVLTATITAGQSLQDLGLLIRYHQSSERGFSKAHTELVKAQKDRKKSEIGFESQTAGQPAETPAGQPPNPAEPPHEPRISVPEPPKRPEFVSLTEEPEALTNDAAPKTASDLVADLKARQKAA